MNLQLKVDILNYDSLCLSLHEESASTLTCRTETFRYQVDTAYFFFEAMAKLWNLEKYLKHRNLPTVSEQEDEWQLS